MSVSDDIEAEAADWLARRDAGPLSPAEQSAFDAWLASDSRNGAVYARLEEAWRRADRLRWVRPLDGPVNEDLLATSPLVRRDDDTHWFSFFRRARRRRSTLPPRRPERRRIPVRKLGLLALGLVAAAIVLRLIFFHEAWQRFATNHGGFARVVLEDGSVVNLNTDSAVRVRFTPDHRDVVLERGEALFKVTHDPKRPFDVQAAGTTVRAVGTEFAVRLREAKNRPDRLQNVEVLVREGRVAIRPPEPLALTRPESASNNPPQPQTLSAGEVVTVTAQRMQVKKVAEHDVARKLSWLQGRLLFERERLADVVAEFNRYNRRQLIIADPAIADFRMGGSFEVTDIDSFTAALERTLPVRIDRSDRMNIRLYARAPNIMMEP